MTLEQQIITILLCTLATILTRAIPFILFSEHEPAYIRYLGNALPSAIFAMLVVYCLKNVEFLRGSHGIPEILAIAVTTILHLKFRQMLISIAGGTIFYMLITKIF